MDDVKSGKERLEAVLEQAAQWLQRHRGTEACTYEARCCFQVGVMAPIFWKLVSLTSEASPTIIPLQSK